MKAAVARFVWRMTRATGRAHVPLRASPERAVCNRRLALTDVEASPHAHRCLLCADRAANDENGAMWGLQVGEAVGGVKQKADPMVRSPRPSSSSEPSRLERARDQVRAFIEELATSTGMSDAEYVELMEGLIVDLECWLEAACERG